MEKILNEISLKYNEGFFSHNVQSVRTLMNIENKGLGNNITVQVLDAILCHNGEMLQNIYYPQEKEKTHLAKEEYQRKSTLGDCKRNKQTMQRILQQRSSATAAALLLNP